MRGARMCSPTDKRDRAARALDFVRDLGAARRSADDQDAAVGELAGIAVLLRRQRARSTRGTRSAKAGTPAMLQAPEASTTVRHRQSPWSVRTRYPVSVAAHRGDRRVGPHRRRDRLRIVRDEVDDLGQRPVAVGIVALVAESRQPALPVGRQQPQRIPALGAPAMGDLAALQHHVIDRALREATAHGEAGVPGTDDRPW